MMTLRVVGFGRGGGGGGEGRGRGKGQLGAIGQEES